LNASVDVENDMKLSLMHTTRGLVAAALVTTLAGQAQAQTPDAVVNADADTTIKASNAASNYGSAATLNTAGLPRERTLVRFDTTKLQAAAGTRPVVSAILEMTVQSASPILWGNDVSLHRTQKAWTEGGATWSCANDSAPTNSTNNCTSANSWAMTANQGYDGASATTRMNRGTAVLKFDVTADVKKFLSGAKVNNGWLLKLVIEGPPVNVLFKSREAASGKPRIVLDLGGSADAGPVGAPCSSDAGCGGYANAICFTEEATAIPGGYCSALCDADSQCPSGSACIANACALPCGSNDTCAPGYYCLDTGSTKACLPTCTSDADCSGGRVCAPAINECRPPE
jgi:hypothetical protein